MMEFTTKFNELTSAYDPSLVLHLKVSAKNRKFTIQLGFISTSLLIKKILGYSKLPSKGQDPLRMPIHKLYMVLLIKKLDPRFKHVSSHKLLLLILGTLRTMNIELEVPRR